MRVVVLAGGVGGARFLGGLLDALKDDAGQADSTAEWQIEVIVNTGDDLTVHGLRVCPDLDTIMYTLGDGIDAERGWGRRAETWNAKEELAAYGATPDWFGLGDRDIATHLIRTRMLDAGYPLSDVTAALCERWRPGVTLLPMSDQRVETHVVCEIDGSRRVVHFQEWWIAQHAEPPVEEFVQVGLAEATPGPGVLAALAAADAVLIGPSNPVVSIGTILAVPGIREAIRTAPGGVVGISPIVGGSVVRGMADRCLPVIDVPVSAEGVGRHYGSRGSGSSGSGSSGSGSSGSGSSGSGSSGSGSRGSRSSGRSASGARGSGSGDGLLDGWLIDAGDTADVPGVEVRAVPLLMHDTAAAAAIARVALQLAAG